MVPLGMVEKHVLEQLTHTISLEELQEQLDIAEGILLRVVQLLYELDLVLLTVGLREDKPLVLLPTSHWCRGECGSTLCLLRLEALCAYIQ
ncbi:hypothetical protein RCJ22_03910, partial [Vibrio sp. FNV 38]|nr:hypothetical protein [Vibrio sp. FNV 38]